MARNSSEFVPDSNTEFPAVPEIRVEKIKIEEVRASIPLKDLESKKTKKSKKCKNLIFDIGKDAKASSSKICGLEHLPVSNHGKGADSSDPGIEFLVNEKVKGTKKAKFSKPKDPKGPKGNKNETAKVEGFPATETDDFITPTTSATAYTNKPTLFSKFTHLACTIFLKEFILFILCNFWTALIIDICLNVLYIISFYAISYPYCVVHSCPVVMLLIDAVLITLKVWDRCARRFLPEEKKIVWGWFRRQHVLFLVRVLKQLVLFVIIGMIIGKIVFLIGGTINNPLDVSRSVMLNLDLNLVNRILLIIFASISIFADFYLLSHLWKLPEKGSGSILLLAISCFANFLLGIIEIKLYHDSMIFKNVGSTAEAYEPLRVLPVIYLYTAAFVICGSTLGLALTAIVTESNRLSDTVGKMTIFLDCYFLIVTLLALISCANSLVLRGGEQDPRYHIALGIPTIFGCSVILSILIIICSRYTRSRLPPSLEVEELNLKDLTDAQKSAYAKLITFNTKANPGISGEAVILLMESYTAANLEGMSCRVLRVFRPEINVNSYDVNGKKMKGNRRNILNFKNSKEKENNHNQNDDDNYNEKFNKKNIDGSNASFSLSTSSIYSVNNEYEASKTWEVLDLQKTVFDEEETIFSIESVEPPKVLSKNQRKKLAKKAAAAAANGDITGEFPLELPTEKDIRDRAKFHSDLMATEALILLTTIESYDLTASIQGKFGKFMTRHFGAESKYKLLCIRFGLLAFHWPFIRSTFYCSNSKKPVARSAAVMYAINRWNNQQSKGERRTILLDPTYKNAVPEQAIRFGGG